MHLTAVRDKGASSKQVTSLDPVPDAAGGASALAVL
jgi:hypothetical protein